jgi:hypothetical protein
MSQVEPVVLRGEFCVCIVMAVRTFGMLSHVCVCDVMSIGTPISGHTKVTFAVRAAWAPSRDAEKAPMLLAAPLVDMLMELRRTFGAGGSAPAALKKEDKEDKEDCAAAP